MIEYKTFLSAFHTFRALSYINPEITAYGVKIPLIGSKERLIEKVDKHLADANINLTFVINELKRRGIISESEIREIEDKSEELKRIIKYDRERAVEELRKII